MGEWVIGAFINIFGSIAINFGTNLLKLGHNENLEEKNGFSRHFNPQEMWVHYEWGDALLIVLILVTWAAMWLILLPWMLEAKIWTKQYSTRERLAMQDSDGTNGKLVLKPIIYFQTWRVGILFFALGNCLNFISFGYAAQSLLAALGSIQFVSNIAFAYFVLNKTVTSKVMVATAFIVLGNIFLVAFGNHQSPVYTPEQLVEKYSNIVFLFYCMILMVIVAANHSIYRRGELLLSIPGHDLRPYWRMLLPFSYATVSGAVGSCSVLFAKSLSNMLRLTMARDYQFHSWFTYSMLLLFFSTAGFWMARLNEGLSLYDAILIVPMFQIAWTLFSICTGFVYFQEYQVFNALRTLMFILGMTFVFIGISLLAPDDSKGGETKESSSLVSATSSNITPDMNRPMKLPTEETEIKDLRSLGQAMLTRVTAIAIKAKTACVLSLGLGEDSISASSVLVMPMVSSRMTGFRGAGYDRVKLFPLRSSDWSKIPMEEEDPEFQEASAFLSQNHRGSGAL